MRILRDYSWPGNIRELENVVKQTLVQATGSVIIPDFLPPFVTCGPTGSGMEGGTENEVENLSCFMQRRIKAGSENLYAESIEFLVKMVR